jgi:Putative Flp pilus-assembly TadE/G-like
MTTKPNSVFWALPQQLVSDTRGVTLALVAAAVSALIGFTGLGVETGLWYAMKRQNQSAADVAALSGAFELLAGQSSSLTATQTYANICGFAKRDATRNGFTFLSFTCPTSTPACTSPSSGQMCANNPPATAGTPNFGNANAVEVILAQQQNALFASLSLANVTIGTRAVAVISILDQSCLLALDSNPADHKTILIQGNSTINMPNCSIADDNSNSDAIFLQGSAATLTADTLVSAGGVGSTGNPTFNLNTPAKTYAPPVPNPYASGTCTTLCITHAFLTTGPPAMPTTACSTTTTPVVKSGVTWSQYQGNCTLTQSGSVLNQNNIILSANTRLSGGIQIKGQILDLSPGTYWIDNGDLQLGPGGATSLLECTTCNGTNLGVTIIFTTSGSPNKIGTVTMQSTSAQIGNLNAPNSGTFAGLLFVQDTVAGATYTTNGTIQGGPNVALNGTGLVYFPHTNVTFQGTPQLGTSGCLVVVAQQVTVAGDSTLSTTGCSSAGLGTAPTVKTVALAE